MAERLDRRFEINEWVRALHKVVPTDTLIDVVRARRESSSGEERDDLTFELKLLLAYPVPGQPARYDEALQLIDSMIAEKPDDVRYPISKATLYLYSLDNPEEALKWIDLALERAFRTKFFLREALGTKARILLKLRRGEELGQVLEQIMSLDTYRDIPDIGLERDFVDRAPPGLISNEIVARYNRFYPTTQRHEARLDWLRELRAKLPLDEMIDRVRSRIEEGGDDKSQYAFSLGRLCTDAGRYDEALHWFDRSSAWDGDDPRPLVRKAMVHLAHLDEPQKALQTIELALQTAFRTKAFRRWALGVKARILSKLGRSAELGPILEQIMSLQKSFDDPDLGRERDFVDDAPPGAIPPDVLARYDAFCPPVG